jgi:hypothetical protein
LARANPNGEKGEEKMAEEETRKSLKHYTSIETLFKILDTGYLLLGDPEKWEDKNDSAAVRAFCRLKGEGIKARVLCFLDGDESIHHRNAFAKNGCSISIDRDCILKQTNKTSFLHGSIEYRKDIKATELRKLAENEADKIPFLKRRAYECEKEYRLIWFGKAKSTPKIKLDRRAIKRIILSPGMPDSKRKELQSKIKMRLEKRYGKNRIKVDLSRLLEYERWISKFDHLGKKR